MKRKESERTDNYLDLAKELKNDQHEVEESNSCNSCPWNCPQRSRKQSWETENQKKNGDHPDHNNSKLDQET